MLAVGLLMIEHRLIERMIKVLKTHLKKIRDGRREDPVFIAMVVDFFRTYADRTHHGKEEGILFRDLAKKHLSSGHKKTLDELIAEHVYARQEVTALLDANKKY